MYCNFLFAKYCVILKTYFIRLCLKLSAEPAVNKNEILEPESSARVECEQDSSLKGQEENEAVTVSEVVSNEKIAIPLTNGMSSYIH